MQERIGQLQSCENFKEGLRNTCRANHLSITILNGLTIKRVSSIYSRTLLHYESNPDKARNSWFENQLRLFHWVLIIESFLTGQPLNQFTPDQWFRIQTYFPPKSATIFQFETKKLLGNDAASNSRLWELEECQLLTEIMRDQTLINRWNEVARKFYELSGKRYYRSSKQCRQQWFNHLDDSKIHGSWQEHQDRIILEFVYKHGHKWAQMCKEVLNHRTQHMIKNRFKSLIMKGQQSLAQPKTSERKLIKRILAKKDLTPQSSIVSKQQKKQQKLKKQKQVPYDDPNEGNEEIWPHSGHSESQNRENDQREISIGNQIIGDGHCKQQKQVFENSQPLRPIPLVQPYFPFTNHLQPDCQTRASLFSQVNDNPSPPGYPFFTCFPACFSYFPQNISQGGQNEGQNENLEKKQ